MDPEIEYISNDDMSLDGDFMEEDLLDQMAEQAVSAGPSTPPKGPITSHHELQRLMCSSDAIISQNLRSRGGHGTSMEAMLLHVGVPRMDQALLYLRNVVKVCISGDRSGESPLLSFQKANRFFRSVLLDASFMKSVSAAHKALVAPFIHSIAGMERHAKTPRAWAAAVELLEVAGLWELRLLPVADEALKLADSILDPRGKCIRDRPLAAFLDLQRRIDDLDAGLLSTLGYWNDQISAAAAANAVVKRVALEDIARKVVMVHKGEHHRLEIISRKQVKKYRKAADREVIYVQSIADVQNVPTEETLLPPDLGGSFDAPSATAASNALAKLTEMLNTPPPLAAAASPNAGPVKMVVEQGISSLEALKLVLDSYPAALLGNNGQFSAEQNAVLSKALLFVVEVHQDMRARNVFSRAGITLPGNVDSVSACLHRSALHPLSAFGGKLPGGTFSARKGGLAMLQYAAARDLGFGRGAELAQHVEAVENILSSGNFEGNIEEGGPWTKTMRRWTRNADKALDKVRAASNTGGIVPFDARFGPRTAESVQQRDAKRRANHNGGWYKDNKRSDTFGLVTALCAGDNEERCADLALNVSDSHDNERRNIAFEAEREAPPHKEQPASLLSVATTIGNQRHVSVLDPLAKKLTFAASIAEVDAKLFMQRQILAPQILELTCGHVGLVKMATVDYHYIHPRVTVADLVILDANSHWTVIEVYSKVMDRPEDPEWRNAKYKAQYDYHASKGRSFEVLVMAEPSCKTALADGERQVQCQHRCATYKEWLEVQPLIPV